MPTLCGVPEHVPWRVQIVMTFFYGSGLWLGSDLFDAPKGTCLAYRKVEACPFGNRTEVPIDCRYLDLLLRAAGQDGTVRLVATSA